MKKITLNLLALLLAIQNFAQFFSSETQSTPKLSIAIVPHTLLFNGIRIDLEYSKAHQGLVISPLLYYINRPTHPVSYGEAKIYKLFGVGLGTYYKYIKTNEYGFQSYFALGAVYTYFNTNFYQYIWEAHQVYGNTIYFYIAKPIKGNIHRLEANISLGLRKYITEAIFGEVNIGVGYRYAMKFFNPLVTNALDRVWDYGYSGPIFIFAIKIGFSKNLNQNQLIK